MIKSYKRIKPGQRFSIVSAPHDCVYEVVCQANNCGGFSIPSQYNAKANSNQSNNVIVYKIIAGTKYFGNFFCRSTEYFCQTCTIIPKKKWADESSKHLGSIGAYTKHAGE